MNCKVCNTRLGAGDRSCPNCGNEVRGAGGSYLRASERSSLPAANLSTARDEPEAEEDVELELDEVTNDPERGPGASGSSGAGASGSGVSGSGAASSGASGSGAVRPPPKPSRAAKPQREHKPVKRKPAGAAPLFSPDAGSMRAMLAEQPEILEPGLRLYTNDEGVAVGARYRTDVGDIDLLASDRRGDLVVVMISEKEQAEGEDLVSEVLRRLGWVRKHLGDGKTKVRGIVLCVDVPEDLSYAAAAVIDTVAFKTYRVALTFEDLEV
jgi:hypothetical protein